MDKTETGSEIYSFFLFNHSIIWWYQWKRKKNYRIQIQEMYSYNLHTDTHTHILGYWCHICYTWCGYYGDAKMLIFLLCYVMLFFLIMLFNIWIFGYDDDDDDDALDFCFNGLSRLNLTQILDQHRCNVVWCRLGVFTHTHTQELCEKSS